MGCSREEVKSEKLRHLLLLLLLLLAPRLPCYYCEPVGCPQSLLLAESKFRCQN
jgi:hypothetical protein